MAADNDRYLILGEIASGATATVFLAEDKVLRRKVALKKLHPHLLNHAETVRRFETEARAVGALSHENVIRVFDFGRSGKDLFLAMELVEGISLEALLEPARRVPNLAALSLFQQIFRGLAAAHEKGIFHRDIKPSNVLLDRKGAARIADFGIAFLNEDKSLTLTGSFLGTPRYSAPEQAEGRTASDRTDVFAAGIMLHRCLTGALPFDGETHHSVLKAVVERKAPKPALMNPRLLPGLSVLAEAMLEKRPGDRPSAAECGARLESLARESGFPIEARRLARFIEAPEACGEEERAEIAAHFRAEAERAGTSRLAAKRAALAEVFSGEGPAVDEAELARSRRGMTAIAVSVAAIAALGLFVRSRPKPVPAASGPAGAQSAPHGGNPAAAPPQPLGAKGASADTVTSKLPPDSSGGAAAFSNAPPGTAAAPTGATASPASPPLASASPSAGSDSAPAPSATPALPTPAPLAAASPVPEPAPSLAGYVMIKTSPAFAAVKVDGNSLGATPFAQPVSLPEGKHDLLLERVGYKPVKATFTVVAGETGYLRYKLEKTGP